MSETDRAEVLARMSLGSLEAAMYGSGLGRNCNLLSDRTAPPKPLDRRNGGKGGGRREIARERDGENELQVLWQGPKQLPILFWRVSLL